MAVIKRTPAISTKQRKLAHERLTSLINSMADAVIAVDERLKVVLYNGAALDILDTNTSIQEKPLVGIFKPLDKSGKPLDVLAIVHAATTPTASRDYSLQYDDGSTVRLYTSIAPVHLGYGHTGSRGYVILLRDITREKSLEEERNEFISVISHELRTPIAITEGNISNALFVAEKQQSDAGLITALKEAHAQVQFLGGMVNDLSTLSRAERGKLEVTIEPLLVSDLLAQLTHAYTPEAATKGLAFHAQKLTHDGTLASTRLYVLEILQNFITNAIKYTDKGSVTIGATVSEAGCTFTVADTGIGISKPDQEKIFDKFFRSEDYRTRQHGGTGLGLYVTQKLIKLLHAEVSLKSRLNKGSTFTIFFPNLH